MFVPPWPRSDVVWMYETELYQLPEYLACMARISDSPSVTDTDCVGVDALPAGLDTWDWRPHAERESSRSAPAARLIVVDTDGPKGGYEFAARGNGSFYARIGKLTVTAFTPDGPVELCASDRSKPLRLGG